MENWRKYRNFRKIENPDDSFTYVITVDGEDVAVSEEIYRAYAQAGYKMENMELGLKRDRVLKDTNGKAVKNKNGQSVVLPEREVSLDKFIAEDWNFSTSAASPEDVVTERLEVEALYSCLDLLEADERVLIEALFFNSLTEREYAKMLGLSKTALHARKVKILAKIKILMNQ